jgi:hypothetical protein
MKPLVLLFIVAYSLAAVTREFLPARAGWLFGLVAFHLVAAWMLRLLTNSTLFAAGSALAATAVEAVLFSVANGAIAIWAGTLIELMFAMHFARRFYLTMGD